MRVTATQSTHFIYDVETYTTTVTPKKDHILSQISGNDVDSIKMLFFRSYHCCVFHEDIHWLPQFVLKHLIILLFSDSFYHLLKYPCMLRKSNFLKVKSAVILRKTAFLFSDDTKGAQAFLVYNLSKEFFPRMMKLKKVSSNLVGICNMSSIVFYLTHDCIQYLLMSQAIILLKLKEVHHKKLPAKILNHEIVRNLTLKCRIVSISIPYQNQCKQSLLSSNEKDLTVRSICVDVITTKLVQYITFWIVFHFKFINYTVN